jgi:hypothetical protein
MEFLYKAPPKKEESATIGIITTPYHPFKKSSSQRHKK